jgi:hypothetical protein
MAPGCALDEPGLRTQLRRYRTAGRAARLIAQTPRRLVVELDAGVDIRLVEELVAVERECCPFLTLEWKPDRRRLGVSVSRVEHEPALEAIAFALDLSGSAPNPPKPVPAAR